MLATWPSCCGTSLATAASCSARFSMTMPASISSKAMTAASPIPPASRNARVRRLNSPPEAVRAAGLPGVIAKHAGSAYRAGGRDDWRRIAVSPAADAEPTEPVELEGRREGGGEGERVDLTIGDAGGLGGGDLAAGGGGAGA